MTAEHLSKPAAPFRPGPQRTVAWLLPAALLLPIGLAFVLIHYYRKAQAIQDAAVHRATVVYSGVVAWQFARHASNLMHRAGDAAIYQIDRAENGAVRIRSSDRAAILMSSYPVGEASEIVARAASVFRYDFETHELVGAGPRFRSEHGTATSARIRALFPDSLHDPHQLRFDRRDGRTVATVYGLVRGEGDRARAAYGIEVDADVFAPMFDSALASGALLPGAMIPSGLRHDHVRITITTPAAETVFVIGGARGNALSATDTVEAARGGLRLTVELDSAFAKSLVMGETSAPPLRLIALLLVVSSVLAVAAVVQVRRSRALAEMRAQFVANVSHELRTPLTHISMFAETLMRYPERAPDERFRFASIIHREARRLTNLVDGVLRFARLDAGRERIELVPTDLSAEIREALEVFRPMLDGARATLVCDIPDHVMIRGDGSAIRQILVNLLDNAIKYGPLGQAITLRVRLAGPRATLDVADESNGIPPEHRERVFEPFTRAAGARDRMVSGAGLGLAVVRSLVSLHGGTVEITAAPGGGTLVRITLIRISPDESTRTTVDSPGAVIHQAS